MRYALSRGQLLSISRYVDLPNPPQDLTCPGQDTHGRPCRAPAGPRALTSKHCLLYTSPSPRDCS